MTKYYTGTLCSKVHDIESIILGNDWGVREDDIQQILQLVHYIQQDGQAMEDKLYERKYKAEEDGETIKLLENRIEELEDENEELHGYMDNASSCIDSIR